MTCNNGIKADAQIMWGMASWGACFYVLTLSHAYDIPMLYVFMPVIVFYGIMWSGAVIGLLLGAILGCYHCINPTSDIDCTLGLPCCGDWLRFKHDGRFQELVFGVYSEYRFPKKHDISADDNV